MKGQTDVINALNKGLALEMLAINTYFIQAKMCKNWGYSKLAKKQYDESIEEMKHAELLIDRILFLEGVPNLSVGTIKDVGNNVKSQFENDLALETQSVAVYNEAIQLCEKHGDAGSRDILTKLLAGSEEHVDWLESQLSAIKDIGTENYLAQQL
jgi:bacterioferritin